MTGSRGLALVVLLLSFSVVTRAQRDAPRESATLEVANVTGALVAADVADLPTSSAAALGRCATRRTATIASDTTTFELAVDARGRVLTATVIGAGGGGRDTARAQWLGCVADAMRAAHLPRRDAVSTITVRVTWSSGAPGSGLSGRRGSHFDHSIETHRVTVEEAPASYSLEVLRTAVQTHAAEVRHCYDTELHDHPGMEGTITVAFTIQPDGSVTAVSAREDQPNVAGLTSCVLAAVARWTFPPPDAGRAAEVTYPFVFRQAERAH